MFKSYKQNTIIILVSLGHLLCFMVGNASALEKVTLQLRWFHQFQFAGYYAAVEQGYYQDAGLNVLIKETKLGLDTIEEVIKGRVQYGIGGANLLLHRNNGKPVVVLAAIFQHSPLILLSRAESRILSPQDMIGRRIMMVNWTKPKLLP